MPDGRIGKVMRPSGPLPSLTAQATTGVGTTFPLGGAFTTFGVYLNRASTGVAGGSTSAKAQLQGSVDGTHFVAIGGSTLLVNSSAGTFVARSSTIGPVCYARLLIKSFTTATNVNPDKVAVNGYITVQGV